MSIFNAILGGTQGLGQGLAQQQQFRAQADDRATLAADRQAQTSLRDQQTATAKRLQEQNDQMASPEFQDTYLKGLDGDKPSIAKVMSVARGHPNMQQILEPLLRAKPVAPRDPVADHAANRAHDLAHPAPPTAKPPTVHDRIMELSKGGMPLSKAYTQARMEFGESSTDAVAAARTGAREDRLQQNYQDDPAVKHAGLLANAVAQLKASAAQKTPQGDLNMLYGAVKLRDPNAVREGELALNNKARSAHTQLFALWQRVTEGRILTDQERQQVMDLVDQTVGEQSKLIAPVQARFGARAKAVGADSAFVAPDPFAGTRGSSSANRPPGFRP